MRDDDVWPELLRRAEARRIARAETDAPPPTDRPGAFPAHLRADHVLRAELYRSDTGWGVSLRLDPDKTPPGASLVFGTPPSMRLPTREAALCVGALLAERMLERAAEATSQIAWFRLHDRDVGITRDFFEQFAPVWREALRALGPDRATWFAVETLDSACARLRVETDGLPDPSEFDADPDAARRFLGAIAICLHAGLRRWPTPHAASPAPGPRVLH
jgi:hypothetical protein